MSSAFEEFAQFCKSYDGDLEKMATARSLIQGFLQNPLKPEVAATIVESGSTTVLRSKHRSARTSSSSTSSETRSAGGTFRSAGGTLPLVCLQR